MVGRGHRDPDVAIAVGVNVVGLAVTVRVNGCQAKRRICRGGGNYFVCVIVVVQAVSIQVHHARAFARRCNITGGGLRFNIVGDAVVVGINVQAIHNTVLIGIYILPNVRAKGKVDVGFVVQIGETEIADRTLESNNHEALTAGQQGVRVHGHSG